MNLVISNFVIVIFFLLYGLISGFFHQATCVTVSLFFNLIFCSSVSLCVYGVVFYALAHAVLNAEYAGHII